MRCLSTPSGCGSPPNRSEQRAAKSPAGFDEMPEVREVLEAHLDVSHEPTRTIRSVYGDHLTMLGLA